MHWMSWVPPPQTAEPETGKDWAAEAKALPCRLRGRVPPACSSTEVWPRPLIPPIILTASIGFGINPLRRIWIHKIFAPIRRWLPAPLSSTLHNIGTSVATPIYFSRHSGHFLSSMKNRSVDRTGEPIPWYSYPAIDFLNQRNHSHRSVLEFGAGCSTLFWAKRCGKVLAFEGNPRWFHELNAKLPSNVDLKAISVDSRGRWLRQVEEVLRQGGYGKFDLVVIDGLHRKDLARLSTQWVHHEGAVVADDAESWGCCESFKDLGFQRVDFFGHAPATFLPHCTSIYFKEGCYLFDSSVPIPDLVFK